MRQAGFLTELEDMGERNEAAHPLSLDQEPAAVVPDNRKVDDFVLLVEVAGPKPVGRGSAVIPEAGRNVERRLVARPPVFLPKNSLPPPFVGWRRTVG
jgi:hypothetical protein